MEIRYLTHSDNRLEISKIYEASWKYAYRDIIPQAYLDSIPKGNWAAALDAADRQTLVCLDDGNYIGTSSFGKSRLAQYPDCGEIISIYLLPEYIGKGYGKALLKAVVSELKKQGFEEVFLWALEDNTKAKNFYTHFGFAITEDRLNIKIGGKELREVRFVYK